MRKNRPLFPAVMEQLEERMLLTVVVVTVAYSPTSITIKSDAGSAAISMNAAYGVTPYPGTTLVIKGTPPAVGANVNINIDFGKASQGYLSMALLTCGKFTYKGGAGNDSLYTTANSQFNGKVTLALGNGDNVVSLWSAATSAGLAVTGGSGADNVQVSGSFLGASSFKLGGGADHLLLAQKDAATSLSANFGGPVTIQMAGGTGSIDMAGLHANNFVSFTDALTIKLPSGAYTLSTSSGVAGNHAYFYGKTTMTFGGTPQGSLPAGAWRFMVGASLKLDASKADSSSLMGNVLGSTFNNGSHANLKW